MSTRRQRLGAQVHHSGFSRQATPRRLLARTEPFLEKLKYVLIRQQATVVGLDADSFFCREPISLSNTIQESCEAASVTDHWWSWARLHEVCYPNELKGTWKNMNYCLGMFTPGAGVCILLLCNLGVYLKLLLFHFWHFCLAFLQVHAVLCVFNKTRNAVLCILMALARSRMVINLPLQIQ